MPEQIQETAVSSNVKTSKSAIWSLICGIAGLILCLPSIPAVILGIIALVNINNAKGLLKGTGMAIAGLILAGLSVVVVPFIIGLVAAIVIPLSVSRQTAKETYPFNELNKTKATKSNIQNINIQDISAKTDIANIGSALELYKMDSGDYPSNEQGIQVLINNEQEIPYIDNIPDDPWGRPYQYHYPGENNKDSFDLWSPGADGKDGTPDDITNWQATSG